MTSAARDASPDVEERWRIVEAALSRARRLPVGPFVVVSHEQRDLTNAVVLLLAYSALESALDALKQRGDFERKTHRLGPNMEAARNAGVPWRDYASVERGKEARDALAHQFRIPPRAEVWRFADAVGAELRGWGLLS